MSVLVGRQASFTWSTGPSIDVANGHIVRSTIGRNPHDSTPFGYDGERFTLATRTGRVSLRTYLSSSLSTGPAIPNGTVGTLVVNMNSTESWTATAQLVQVTHSAQSGGGSPPQYLDYDLLVSATSTSDPVTVTS